MDDTAFFMGRMMYAKNILDIPYLLKVVYDEIGMVP